MNQVKALAQIVEEFFIEKHRLNYTVIVQGQNLMHSLVLLSAAVLNCT